MDEKKRDLEHPRYQESRDQGTYQTGSTCPPKNHSGLIALLLIAVILLCGIVSALGLLNIRQFREANQQPEGGNDPISFSDTLPGITAGSTVPEAAEPNKTASVPNFSEMTLKINQSPASSENIPQADGLSLQSIYLKVIDSVVSISCTTSSGTSSGTGVVLSGDGYLVTNCHVVANATSISAQFTDGRTLEARLVGSDSVSDLAVLYVEADDLKAAEFGDSSALRVGDAVAAIGDPLGAELRGTMTDGIVSAINRDITTGGRTMTLIQTNAALNAGNSGGPLLNCYGQVIGINTMKIGDYMSSAGVEGLGFAIPSTTVKEIVDQLVRQGYVSGRPYLGITVEPVSTFYQMYYRLPEGLYISHVEPGSDAEKKGLQSGDILLSLDGVRLTGTDSLNSVLYSHQVGDTLPAIIYRGGTQYSLDIVLTEATG